MGFTWKFPKIFEFEATGKEARELYDNAQIMLKKIIKENRLKSKAVFGIFPARTNQNDEIEVYNPINNDLLNKFICLRQQT